MTDLLLFIAIPSIIVSPLLILAIIGLAVTPIAAIVGAVHATMQKRGALRAAWESAVLSTLFFLPWVWLMARNLEWHHSPRLIERILQTIVVIWGFTSILVFSVIVLVLGVTLFAGAAMSGGGGQGLFQFFPVLLFPAAFFGVNIWVWNRMRIRVFGGDSSQWEYLASDSNRIPNYIIDPLLCAYTWTVIGPLLILGVILASLRFTFG